MFKKLESIISGIVEYYVLLKFLAQKIDSKPTIKLNEIHLLFNIL